MAYSPKQGKNQKNKNKEIDDSRYIYQNKQDKFWFQHNMVYGDFKDLPRRTVVDKALCDKAFNIAKYRKYDGYQRDILQWFKKFSIKRLQVVLLKVNLNQTNN